MLLVSSLQCSTRIFFEAVACQLNRELKQRRRGRQRERQKSIGLISRTTTLHVHHAFLYTSLPSLPDYNVKVPEFTFCRGRQHKTTTFFSFPEL